jgi:hypothetical protein
MRAEIRRLIREETEAYFKDSFLLDTFNRRMTIRAVELMNAHEGWFTEETTSNLVANQREYAVPEGGARLKRIVIVRQDGSTIYEAPIVRDELFSTVVFRPASGSSVGWGWHPTGRFVGSNLVLSPPPPSAITNGLRWEIEAAPARLTGDASTLALSFPDVAEDLLVYDTAIEALSSETAQTDVEPDYVAGLRDDREPFVTAWSTYIEQRWSGGRTFGTPNYYGD